MEYQFSGSNNYRIMDTFLDSKKDFIILGLCGKTGSGSTTIAQILQTPFAKLNLPQPGDAVGDMWEAAEYRIFYTYAQKHWKSFFRIKSSSLITAHMLLWRLHPKMPANAETQTTMNYGDAYSDICSQFQAL